MNHLIDTTALSFLFIISVLGVMYNLILQKETYRTKPLNVSAPLQIYSMFKMNIVVLSVTSLFIILALIFYLATS